jgi:hypothetical protein
LELECLEDRTLLSTTSPIASGLPLLPSIGAGQQISALALMNLSDTDIQPYGKTASAGSIAALDQPLVAPNAAQPKPATLSAEVCAYATSPSTSRTEDTGSQGREAGAAVGGFFKLIDDFNAGQLLSLASNVFQVAQGLFGLFGNDSTAQILDRIDSLDRVIRQGFQDLGSLINTESQRVIEHLDLLALQHAIAQAKTAENDLRDYKTTGFHDYLANAADQSSSATEFLIQQNDPYYIVGLVTAGNARIDVFRASDPNWAHNPGYVSEINGLIGRLAGMLDTVRNSVESLHNIGEYVDYATHIGPPPIYETIDGVGHSDPIGYVEHLHRGRIVSSFAYSPEDPASRAQAITDAQHDRSVGIANELAYLSIPQFQSILDSWRNLTKSFWVTPSTTTPTAGTPFTITVEARDSQRNLLTGYTGTVHFSSSDGQAVLPADYTFTTGPGGDNGVHTFTITLKTAAAQWVAATDTASHLSAGSADVTVRPAAASRFDVGAPAAIRAGVSFPISVTAYDPYGNVATGYTGTVHITSDDGVSDYYYFGPGGVHTFNVTLTTAGDRTVTVADTTSSPRGAARVTVTPATANSFRITGFPSPTTAGVEGTFTVTARDPFGNIDTAYRGTVTFSSTDRQAVLPADYFFTTGSGGDNGAHTFRGTLLTAGSQSITATDTQSASITDSQTDIVVTAAIPHLQVSIVPSVTAGVPFDIVITAWDEFGDIDVNYRGTVSFSTSDRGTVSFSTTDPDPGVVLPEDYTFTADDAGVHTFAGAFTLVTPGSQVITVRDVDSGRRIDVTVVVGIVSSPRDP